MEESINNWGEKELEGYTLIYFANADFNKTAEEKEYIKQNVGEETFKKMQREFKDDNDYQSIQKIQAAVTNLKMNEQQISELFSKIKTVCKKDGDFDTQERNLKRGLKHILK